MVFSQLTEQLGSLNNLLQLLSNEQYNKKIKHLGNATIGGHTRHVIELFQCTLLGYQNGMIDYYNRQRNLQLETNIEVAKETLTELLNNIPSEDRQLLVFVEPKPNTPEISIQSTYYREVVFNTEHTIHHLALMKVALIEMELELVNKDFGMAYSTIKYHETLTLQQQ